MIHHYDVISIFMTSFLFFDIFCFTTQSFHRIFVKLTMYMQKAHAQAVTISDFGNSSYKKVDVIISPLMEIAYTIISVFSEQFVERVHHRMKPIRAEPGRASSVTRYNNTSFSPKSQTRLPKYLTFIHS